MALLKTRKSPYWYVDFRDALGRRHRISTGTDNKRVAQQIETKIKADVASGKFLGVRRGTLLLKDALERYVAWQKAIGKRYERSNIAARNILTIIDGNTPVAKLGLGDVERLKRERLKQVSPATVQRELNVLQAALNRAVEKDEVKSNPLRGRIRRFKLQSRKRILSDDEVDRLFCEASNGPRYLLVALSLMLGCGLRRGEALSLTWQDVDLAAGSITVQAKKTKTTRVVPLPDWVKEILASSKRALKRSPGRTVVAKEDGSPIASIRRSFASCLKRAKIKGIVLHDLRRTYATRMAKAGASPWVIQRLLGHSALETSQIYVAISDAAMRRAVAESCPAPSFGAGRPRPGPLQKSGDI